MFILWTVPCYWLYTCLYPNAACTPPSPHPKPHARIHKKVVGWISEVILYHRKVIYVQPGFITEAFWRRSSPSLPGPLHIPPHILRLPKLFVKHTKIYLSHCIKINLGGPNIPTFSWGACPQDSPLYSFPPKLEILDRISPPIMAAFNHSISFSSSYS